MVNYKLKSRMRLFPKLFFKITVMLFILLFCLSWSFNYIKIKFSAIFNYSMTYSYHLLWVHHFWGFFKAKTEGLFFKIIGSFFIRFEALGPPFLSNHFLTRKSYIQTSEANPHTQCTIYPKRFPTVFENGLVQNKIKFATNLYKIWVLFSYH